MTTARLTYLYRRRGLDHDWFLYEPTHRRPPVVWPDGKRIALCITVPVEFFPLDAPAQPFRPVGALPLGYPDLWNFSNRDYGLRIGIFRIMRVLDSFSLRATTVVNSHVVSQHPRLAAEMALRNWEFVAGGVDMGHVHHGGLGIEEERALISNARDTLTRITGTKIDGWHSPDRSQSQNTLSLVAELGFQYVMDWANDDMPYTMTTQSGPLCALPLTHEWSDRLLLVQHNLTVEEYEAQILQAFEHLHDEADTLRCGRILSLSVSPWIIGYPHRIRALERVLTRILSTGSVWHATGMDIVTAFKSQAS